MLLLRRLINKIKKSRSGGESLSEIIESFLEESNATFLHSDCRQNKDLLTRQAIDTPLEWLIKLIEMTLQMETISDTQQLINRVRVKPPNVCG